MLLTIFVILLLAWFFMLLLALGYCFIEAITYADQERAIDSEVWTTWRFVRRVLDITQIYYEDWWSYRVTRTLSILFTPFQEERRIK